MFYFQAAVRSGVCALHHCWHYSIGHQGQYHCASDVPRTPPAVATDAVLLLVVCGWRSLVAAGVVIHTCAVLPVTQSQVQLKPKVWPGCCRRHRHSACVVPAHHGGPPAVLYVRCRRYMRLDAAAVRALNVLPQRLDGSSSFSLYGILARGKTAMGKRLLKVLLNCRAGVYIQLQNAVVCCHAQHSHGQEAPRCNTLHACRRVSCRHLLLLTVASC